MTIRSVIIYSLALVFAALAGACSPATEVAVPESRVRLHLEQVYGVDIAPTEAIIGALGAAAIGKNGDVYVLDSSQSRLVAFDGDGSVAWVAGARGDGPGDFSAEEAVAFDGVSTLYISNRYGSTVDIWDIVGQYVGTHSVRTLLGRPTARIVGFIAPSYLVLVAGLRETLGSAVFVVDVGNGDWKLASQFEVHAGPKELPEYTNLNDRPWVFAARDSILVGNYGVYEAKVYDSAGTLLRVFSRELATLELPRTFNTPSAGGGFYSRGVDTGALFPPIPVEGGYWMTQVSWPSSDIGEMARQWLADPSAELQPPQMMNSVDVFDSSGDLVSSVVTEGGLPTEGFFFAVGTDMRLYTAVHEPFPQVRRYRVEIGR